MQALNLYIAWSIYHRYVILTSIHITCTLYNIMWLRTCRHHLCSTKYSSCNMKFTHRMKKCVCTLAVIIYACRANLFFYTIATNQLNSKLLLMTLIVVSLYTTKMVANYYGWTANHMVWNYTGHLGVNFQYCLRKITCTSIRSIEE